MKKRRTAHRYPYQARLYIVAAEYGCYPVVTRDVSANGVGVFLKQDVLDALGERGITMEVGDALQLAPTQDAGSSASMDCHITSLRRLSQKNYLMGLMWADENTAARPVIQEMLKEARARG